MKWKITPLPALKDNYIWLIENLMSHEVLLIDPGDADPVLNWLAVNPDRKLTSIFITHHHVDHVGGLTNLLQKHEDCKVYTPSLENVEPSHFKVGDGDHLVCCGTSWQVMHTPGHTLGHVVFYNPDELWLFSGDTLFSGGCGRLFEGTTMQMYNSLKRLADLPNNTQVYCAHEYTLSNLKFGAKVDPNNMAIRNHLMQLQQQSEICTLPSNIGFEKKINVFFNAMRCQSSIYDHFHKKPETEFEAFSYLRQWKDNFK